MGESLSQAIFGGGQEQPASSAPSLMSLAAAELERMGPPAPEKYAEVFPGSEGYGPSVKESLMEALPDMLGANELQDENDILYIANAALMEGKKDPADLIGWLAHKEMLAKMSKMWVEDSKYMRPPAKISQIAKFLRYEAQSRRRFGG